jgi:hypothetical protein
MSQGVMTAASPSLSSALHSEHYDAICTWLAQPVPRTPAALFLYGPPGVGKTTLAHRALKDAGFKTVECNASQFRHKGAMIDLIEPLTKSANVGDYFRVGAHRRIGLILDEIDGISIGDKGGMTELVRIITAHTDANAIICISNEWTEKRYQPLIRHCMCIHVMPPSLESCASWMGVSQPVLEDVWTKHSGDLRKIKQWEDYAEAEETNTVFHTLTVRDLVCQLLRGELDPQEELVLDNNDLNLAGLHLHETLPDWIKVHYGVAPRGWKIYMDCLRSIVTSDRQDYYTFFHQHWSLFPLSFQSKLQAVNRRLFVTDKPTRLIPEDKGWKYQYTAVLARQSWLYNQFKYLCEVRDSLQSTPLRDGGLESALWVTMTLKSVGVVPAFAGVPKDRIGRWFKTLALPPIPPFPVGS